MEIFISFVIGIIAGIFLTKLCTKQDGRFVIGNDEYFVAIQSKPEELAKRGTITLRVVKR